jgi:hypothetical protein
MPKITLDAEPLMTLNNHNQWVNRGPYGYLKNKPGDELLFVDANNQLCTIGADLKAAQYPVTIYMAIRPSHKIEKP